MIAECAVEPEVMARWEHFQSLHGDFGVGQGKLICEFPGSWIRAVLDCAAEYEREGINSPRQAQMILDQFDRHNRGPFLRAITSSERKFPQGANWCAAARSSKPGFDLMIHSSEPQSAKELKAGEFVKNSEPFLTRRQTEVPRKADALIECGWACYRRAKEIRVIDPYFNPALQKFGMVLGKLLARIERSGAKPSHIEVHTELPGVYNSGLQQRHWNRWAESHLPSNWTLKVVHWDKMETGSKMHARYILTDFGGLDYNWGTDEDPQEITQVSLLDDSFWQVLYRRFAWSEEFTPQIFRDFPDRILEVNG
jgi:hypothetical protein